MSATLVVGASWGDEGKGKVVDFLSENFDYVARYQGGNNAGHTIYVKGEKVVLHILPSGVLNEGKISVIGSGCVIDLDILLEEINLVSKQVKNPKIFISESAHVILPLHRQIDIAEEESKGKNHIGTTRRGIGPTYSDKYARSGIRMGDLLNVNMLTNRIEYLLEARKSVLDFYKIEIPNARKLAEEFYNKTKSIHSQIVNTGEMLRDALKQNKNVLLEGAQGIMLDIDLGTYPFVTSSHTGIGGAIIGAEIPPSKITNVIGIVKSYYTRVGTGPFPSFIKDEKVENELRELGAEYGATTGRPRKCGWLDLPALKFAVDTNDMKSIALTKVDILGKLKNIGLCVGYKYNGKIIHAPIANVNEYEKCEAVIEYFEQWVGDKNNINKDKLNLFINAIEKYLGIKVSILSTGPEREKTYSL